MTTQFTLGLKERINLRKKEAERILSDKKIRIFQEKRRKNGFKFFKKTLNRDKLKSFFWRNGNFFVLWKDFQSQKTAHYVIYAGYKTSYQEDVSNFILANFV